MGISSAEGCSSYGSSVGSGILERLRVSGRKSGAMAPMLQKIWAMNMGIQGLMSIMRQAKGMPMSVEIRPAAESLKKTPTLGLCQKEESMGEVRGRLTFVLQMLRLRSWSTW